MILSKICIESQKVLGFCTVGFEMNLSATDFGRLDIGLCNRVRALVPMFRSDPRRESRVETAEASELSKKSDADTRRAAAIIKTIKHKS